MFLRYDSALLCGVCALLLVEWILETRLTTTADGAHFASSDGRMAEALVRTAYRFASWLNVTNLNPLQGIGSQLLPLNVWANPVHWPLAFFDGEPIDRMRARLEALLKANAAP